MKTLILLILLATLLGGCDNSNRIITSKTFFDFYDHRMPDGICRFMYDGIHIKNYAPNSPLQTFLGMNQKTFQRKREMNLL